MFVGLSQVIFVISGIPGYDSWKRMENGGCWPSWLVTGILQGGPLPDISGVITPK